MKFLIYVVIVLLMHLKLGTCINTVFPEEFSSFLSLILATIPMVKKGTESRIGFGFRNSPNSDVQFLIELGPHKYTQPLRGEENDNSIDNTFKREVNLEDVPKFNKSILSQMDRQQSKTKQKLLKRNKKPVKFVSPKTLQNHQQQYETLKRIQNVKKSFILDEESFKQLKSLYKTI